VIGLNGNLGFGVVPVGSSLTNTLTISNGGNSVLTITGLTVSNGLSSVLTASFTSGTIAAGGSQRVDIRFTPTAAQTYSGTLTVNGDQTSGGNSAPLSGTGSLPAGSTPAATTYAVSGVVNDGTTGPSGRIPASVVTVVAGANAGKSTIADASGNYSLPGLTPGSFTLSASHADYQSVTKSVNLSTNTTLDFSLARITTPTPTPTPAPNPNCPSPPYRFDPPPNQTICRGSDGRFASKVCCTG